MDNKIKMVLDVLNSWEKIAIDNEDKFLHEFCHDAWTLIKVYWCSEHMEFVYVLDSGQHVSDSITMEQWMDFLKNNT